MRTYAERNHAATQPAARAAAPAQRSNAAPAATHHFANVYPDVPVPRGGGAPIPAPVRARMERSFGTSFSNVRVHQDGNAERVGALAYTRGNDVHVARGRFDPNSSRGAALIGHELAHVVQQRAGRVAVPQGTGAPINGDPALEKEADRLGAAAARS
jgi:Domain of unknown function (DUF4157)